MKLIILFLILFPYFGRGSPPLSVCLMIGQSQCTGPATSLRENILCDIEGEDSNGCENNSERPLSWFFCEKGKSMACEEKLEAALEEAIKTCADLKTAAQDCCHAPEECVGGSLTVALDSLGKMHEAIGFMKGGEAYCKSIRQTRGMYGGMQGVMASQCRIKAGACTKNCNQKIVPVDVAFKKACGVSIDTQVNDYKDTYTCDRSFFTHYIKRYKGENEKKIIISQVPEECKRTGRESNRRIQDMATNLGTSLLAAVKECKQAAQENNWDTTDWGSTTSYNPGTVVYTSGTSTGTTDSSSGTTTLGGGGATDLKVRSTTDGSSTNSFVDPDLPKNDVGAIPDLGLGGGGNRNKSGRTPEPANIALPQAANPFNQEPTIDEKGPNLGGDVNAQDMTGGLIGSGGGGGGSGLGGGSGGGGFGGGGYRYGGKKQKKKVALGLKSGGKFKGYGGGGARGNSSFRSRGSKKSKRDKRGYASVDLEKWMPKGKQLNNKTNKYGSPHDNIFKRMSDRIQWMCRKKRIDCI